MSLTIQSGGSITLQGGSGGGGAISAVESALSPSLFITSSSTYVPGTEPLSITVTTGTKVLVSINSYISSGSSAGAGVASLEVSGATSIEAGTWLIAFAANAASYSASCSRTFVVPVNAGVNTFAVKYRSALGTPSFALNQLVVQTLA